MCSPCGRHARLCLSVLLLLGQFDHGLAHQIARFNVSRAPRQTSLSQDSSSNLPVAEDLWQTSVSHRLNGGDVAADVFGSLSGVGGSIWRNGDAFADCFKAGLSSIIFGFLMFLLAIAMQWFNEERSIRIETMITRGTEECMSIDSMNTNNANRGKLVHVQGRAVGAVPTVDPQFQDAVVKHCLKLQSTVEVFEWIQTTKTFLEGREKRTQPRFHTEWTTIHHDSMRLRKPILENPALPNGLCLGTFTTVCKQVELGAFVLTDEMVNSFHKFEPAMKRLPSSITAYGHTFHANPRDGYYYMRPSVSSMGPSARLFLDHQVGDVRVHFMCVPDSDATVVAVQCKRDDVHTFVPYRTLPRAPCVTDMQEREKLIEQGDGPLKGSRREIVCCTGGVATCCCCPCNTIACCCGSEIVTEEILYVSDKIEPAEKPFQFVVRRNPCRVWNFRVIGWGVMFLGTMMILGPFSSLLRRSPLLRSYGGAATLILAAMITASAASLVMACVYTCYRPVLAMKWLAVILIIIGIPLVWGTLGYKISQ